METPVLNKKQRKSTLSAKKTKSKETIRHVLSTPYNNSYWPAISSEENSLLRKTLENNLPRIKEAKVNVPWQELKNVPKLERKKFRAEYSKKINLQEIDASKSSGVRIGINDVSKALEKDSLSAVMISSDVHPRLMVQHLIDQAVLYSVPILVVDGLRSVLKDHCGIGSVVLGLEKTISLSSDLSEVRKCVEEIFEKYPLPKNHINYNRTLVRASDVEIMEKGTEGCEKTEINEREVRENYHLKRVSREKRVFVPSRKVDGADKMEGVDLLFQPFSESVLERNKITIYTPLVVKKVKSDRDRKKRIIKSLKRKRLA